MKTTAGILQALVLIFQGEQNDAWPDTLIEELKQVPLSAFEVVQVPPLEQ